MCDKKLSEFGNVKVHEAVHTDDNLFNCTMCGKKFSEFGSIKVHETVHTDDKAFQCTMCDKKLSKFDIRLIHVGGRKFRPGRNFHTVRNFRPGGVPQPKISAGVGGVRKFRPGPFIYNGPVRKFRTVRKFRPVRNFRPPTWIRLLLKCNFSCHSVRTFTMTNKLP